MIDDVSSGQRLGYSLSEAVDQSQYLQMVRKKDLRVGEQVLVKTLNSVYAIRAVGGGLYVVSGGWFDHKGLSPVTTTINGCTWGGSIIKVDIVAARGLCLEFGNKLVTSNICSVIVMPLGSDN